MKTLLEHAIEMLHAVDEQAKIPGTLFDRSTWITKKEDTCTMCAAGAWFAQKHERISISPNVFLNMDQATRKPMLIMDALRAFDTYEAYRLLSGDTAALVPYFEALQTQMDEAWRAKMDVYVAWLDEHNL